MPQFHAKAPQATVSEGLAQGPYMAARAEVEPMTLRTKGVDSTNVPYMPHISLQFHYTLAKAHQQSLPAVPNSILVQSLRLSSLTFFCSTSNSISDLVVLFYNSNKDKCNEQ